MSQCVFIPMAMLSSRSIVPVMIPSSSFPTMNRVLTPLAINPSAIINPIPDVPPVIKAIRPSTLNKLEAAKFMLQKERFAIDRHRGVGSIRTNIRAVIGPKQNMSQIIAMGYKP